MWHKVPCHTSRIHTDIHTSKKQAQTELAALAHLKLRAWQNYENGREMKLGLWELVNAKLENPEIFGIKKTATEAAEE